jgi:hypothetical protein
MRTPVRSTVEASEVDTEEFELVEMLGLELEFTLVDSLGFGTGASPPPKSERIK